MTKEDRIDLMNRSYEAMLGAQRLIDEAQTDREYEIAAAIYDAHRALYWLMHDDRKREAKGG